LKIRKHGNDTCDDEHGQKQDLHTGPAVPRVMVMVAMMASVSMVRRRPVVPSLMLGMLGRLVFG
jgi:hypothetical protein